VISTTYVIEQLDSWGDAATTANNISNSEFLFRLGIVAGIISYISYLILPLILYRLFESVNRTHAVLMVALAVASVPISLFNMIAKVDVLTLLSGFIKKPIYHAIVLGTLLILVVVVAPVTAGLVTTL